MDAVIPPFRLLAGLQGTGTKSRPRYALRAPIGTAYAGSSIASVFTRPNGGCPPNGLRLRRSTRTPLIFGSLRERSDKNEVKWGIYKGGADAKCNAVTSGNTEHLHPSASDTMQI